MEQDVFLNKNQILDVRSKSIEQENTVSNEDLMRVLTEFYITFSRHIKELKETIATISSVCDSQEEQLETIIDKVEILERFCVDPIQLVNLKNDPD